MEEFIFHIIKLNLFAAAAVAAACVLDRFLRRKYSVRWRYSAEICGDDLRRDTVCGRIGKGNLGYVTDALRKLKKYVKKGLTMTRERAII